MFCPAINGECIGEKCRDWNHKTGICYHQEVNERTQEVYSAYLMTAERVKYDTLWTRLIINQMLSDPTIEPEVKEVIQQALQASSSEVAEKLLKDARLID